ncbi:hypothetical protein M885DRAFT_535778, partial [Pelagophyceae sp. CCMP2097]
MPMRGARTCQPSSTRTYTVCSNSGTSPRVAVGTSARGAALPGVAASPPASKRRDNSTAPKAAN